MSHASSKDLLPLLVILESIGKIEIYTSDFTDAKNFFQNDDQVQFNATLLLLINIGEQANRLSQDLRDKYSQIPFQQIRGLRNRVAHDYTGIDYEMVFHIAKKSLPAFRNDLTSLLETELKSGAFDIEELKAAQSSDFYRHINFTAFAP